MIYNMIVLIGIVNFTSGIFTGSEFGLVAALVERLSIFQCVFISDALNGSTTPIKLLSKRFVLSTFINSDKILLSDFPSIYLKFMYIFKLTDGPIDFQGIITRWQCDSIWLVFSVSYNALHSLHVPYNCELYAAINYGTNITIYDVYTLGEEITIRLVGYWILTEGLSFSAIDFALRRINVEGQDLRIYPFPSMDGSHLDLIDAQSEIIDGLTKIMNFSAKIITDDEVVIGNYDLMGRPVVLSTDTIGPTIGIVVNMYVKKQLENLEYYFIRPFHSLVWGCIFGWICTASFCLLSIYVLLNPLCKFTKSTELVVMPLDSFCGQDGSRNYETGSSVRIIKIMCRAVAGVVVPAYSASIVSYMAVRLPFIPFNDLRGLSENQKYRLGGLPNTYQVSFFRDSADPVVIAVRDLNLISDNEHPKDVSEGVERMCEDEQFVFMGFSSLIPKSKPACQILQITKPVTKRLIGFSANPNLTYIPVFRKLMLRFHSNGVINRRQKRLDDPGPDLHAVSSNAVEAVPFDLVDEMFLIIYIGVALSVMMLCMEYVLWKWNITNKKEGMLPI